MGGMNRPVVNVFMSSYNGERFIRRQIESILSQNDVDVRLNIRDDGSSDSTVAIIEEYRKQHENIILFRGENLGHVKSFMWLVYNCSSTDPDSYYAFSDHDDVWCVDKLRSAVSLLGQKTDRRNPALYYSDLKVVDAEEKFIRYANDWESDIDRYMILTFIGIRGCTIVYNHCLQEVILTARVGKIAWHDNFIALLAFWTGIVVYDPNAHILYRQTGENVSITGVNRFDKLRKNILYVYKRLTVLAHERRQMATELLKYRVFIEDIKNVERLAYYDRSLTATLDLLMDGNYFRHRRIINFTNKILIVCRKF